MSNNFATPMMQQYSQIKEKYPNCIIFFRLGDFYEMFMEDAKIGAEVLDITLTSRDRGKDGKIPMAGVPYHAVDSYLPRLVKAGYNVAICEQVGTPNGNNLMQREIVRVVTPGTLLTEGCLDKRENNYIFSVVYTQQKNPKNGHLVGISLADLSTGEFFVQEFELGEKSQLEEILKNTVYKFSPTEAILDAQAYNDPEILHFVKSDNNLSVSFFAQADFYLNSSEKILKEHFSVENLASFGIENKKIAQKAGALLLGYMSSTQKSALTHITTISLLNKEGVVSIDPSTMLNLEIFSCLRTGSKKGSLISFLDETRTSMGARLLRSWLRSPLQDMAQLEARYDAVGFFISHVGYYEKLREFLMEITDIERILSRLSVGIGNPLDLKSLESSLNKVLEIKSFFSEFSAENLPNSLAQIEEKILLDLKDLTQYLHRTIKENAPVDIKSGGIICPGVSVELDNLKESISSSKNWLENLEKQQRQETGISSLKVRFNKVYGYYIEVTKANLELVPSNYIRKQTMVGGERFITQELKDHEERILSSEEKINEIELALFMEAVKKTLEYTSHIKEAALAVATLDCYLCFSYFALSKGFVRPLLIETGDIVIEGGRHPVVESLLEVGSFNPNDTFLSQNEKKCPADKGASLLLLTGPNMSGKSVYIRQVAIIVLLAQIGCFVPARSAKITPVDKIFVRSGASDMISLGVSTFMLEMLEVAYILNNATKNSLVIMDEVGRGTSTYDGISLAWSIAEYLISQNLGCKTLFATHYHELCALEKKYPEKVVNLSVLVKQDSFGKPVFIHKVVEGPAEHSYGISVAEMAGIPSVVTKEAKKILQDLESRGLRVTVSH
ncbi:DNA mismatch repair protein MutS [Patescibacteria group bacterium]|nr:DNA mismatch repair protein MutS [Patescibacteria group bacterium]